MELLPRITIEDIDKYFGVSSASAHLPLLVDQTNNKKKRSKKQLPPPINIDLSKVIFTQHALDRFLERMFKLNPELQIPLTSEELEELAREILAGSTEKEAIEPAIKVMRCITHKFKEARYFINVNIGWRFVVVEKGEQFLVVTIERVRGHDSKPNKIKTMANVMPEDE